MGQAKAQEYIIDSLKLIKFVWANPDHPYTESLVSLAVLIGCLKSEEVLVRFFDKTIEFALNNGIASHGN